MKFIIVLLALSGMACASNPYAVCHDETDIHETENSRNACIQAVQNREQARANYYYSHQSQFQVRPIQAQPVYQMPVTHTTNCTQLGNQLNCVER